MKIKATNKGENTIFERKRTEDQKIIKVYSHVTNIL